MFIYTYIYIYISICHHEFLSRCLSLSLSIYIYIYICIYIYTYTYTYIYIYIYVGFCDTQKFRKIQKMTPPLFAKIQLLIFLRNRHRLSLEKLISPASPIFCFDEVRLHKFEIS